MHKNEFMDYIVNNFQLNTKFDTRVKSVKNIQSKG